MEKVNKLFERFWLIISIGAFIWACIMVGTEGFDKGVRAFVIPGIAFCWYFFRRFMRKRIERGMDQRPKP